MLQYQYCMRLPVRILYCSHRELFVYNRMVIEIAQCRLLLKCLKALVYYGGGIVMLFPLVPL